MFMWQTVIHELVRKGRIYFFAMSIYSHKVNLGLIQRYQ